MIRKFKSLSDTFKRAAAGEEDAQRAIIGCLSNFGCEHLAHCNQQPKWKASWFGLQDYIGALVGEYGESETKAEREVLAELNAARSYSAEVQL